MRGGFEVNPIETEHRLTRAEEQLVTLWKWSDRHSDSMGRAFAQITWLQMEVRRLSTEAE